MYLAPIPFFHFSILKKILFFVDNGQFSPRNWKKKYFSGVSWDIHSIGLTNRAIVSQKTSPWNTSMWKNMLAIIKTRGMVFCYQNCYDLMWKKNVLVIKKKNWNSRLKAKNLQKFWYHQNNLFKQCSERSEKCLVAEWFFNLFLEVSHI